MGKLDFRSDTVTLPTDNMFKKIIEAKLGDDVYGDDITTKELEAKAAKIMNKEAALFVPTGTMGNLLAVMTHTKPGQEVILEESSHIYVYEVAGIARVANVQAKPIRGTDGVMNPEDVRSAIRKENIHFPETGLITLENTHNMSGGMTIPLKTMEEIYNIAKQNNIPVHLDGARIFNAAHYLKTDAKDIAQYADTVMFCLSKGLGAPIGSMLVGTQSFIDRARKNRKLLGGGMRQVGILAAAGIVALEEMTTRLSEDHDNAKLLARKLNEIPGIFVDINKIHSNIVNVDFSRTGFTTAELMEIFIEKGLKVNALNEYVIRFVTHKDVNDGDVAAAVEIIKKIIC